MDCKLEGLYYLHCQNKGADQLHSNCEADLLLCFCMQKSGFLTMRLIIHHLNDGYITVVFVPGSPLGSTKEGKLGYVPGRDGSQLPTVNPSIPILMRPDDINLWLVVFRCPVTAV